MQLAQLILIAYTYQDELVPDFREYFGTSFFKIGTPELSFDEFEFLIRDLLTDTSTRVCAAVHNLQYRVPREGYILMDIYDLLIALNVKEGSRMFYKRPMEKARTDGRVLKGKNSVSVEGFKKAALAPNLTKSTI